MRRSFYDGQPWIPSFARSWIHRGQLSSSKQLMLDFTSWTFTNMVVQVSFFVTFGAMPSGKHINTWRTKKWFLRWWKGYVPCLPEMTRTWSLFRHFGRSHVGPWIPLHWEPTLSSKMSWPLKRTETSTCAARAVCFLLEKVLSLEMMGRNVPMEQFCQVPVRLWRCWAEIWAWQIKNLSIWQICGAMGPWVSMSQLWWRSWLRVMHGQPKGSALKWVSAGKEELWS